MDLAALNDLFAKNPRHRVWGYLRVSSEKQTRDGEGLEIQRDAIVKYASSIGLSEPLFIEEVASATKMMFSPQIAGGASTKAQDNPRPLLLNLMGFLRECAGSHLIVWKLDRLSREVIDQELILKLLWDAKVDIHSTDLSERDTLRGGSTADPQRVLLRTILGAFARYEASVITARMSAGLSRKGSLGGFVGGRVPFGYESKGNEMAVHPYQAQIVRLVFILREKHKLTLSAIRDHLMAHKHASDETVYHKSLIANIIHRKALYQGVYQNRFSGPKQRLDLRILCDTIEETEQVYNTEVSHGP